LAKLPARPRCIQRTHEKLLYFLIDGYSKPFGYVHSSAIPKVSWGEHWTIDESKRLVIFHRSCGTLSYQMSVTDDGKSGCQHQVQYLYEMEMSEDILLMPYDGEAQNFNLMSLEEVMAALRQGEFKLNCGMTWMAFLIRHGHVNAENEADLGEIEARLHWKHDMFVV
jgi:hypothetical protein